MAIELEPGEKLITDPAMGDGMQCEVDGDKMNHVFIKPHKADIVNTLHLTTNRREYNFTLIASPAGRLSYQTVRVHYPRAPMAPVRPQAQWDYSVDGSAEFKPEVMFDSSHSIWMRMPAKSQTWPVPMYKDHGDRVVGNFIAELFPYFPVAGRRDCSRFRKG